MPLTPATLTRHELIGRPVRVVAASNPDLVGIAGEVVMETTRTLSIEESANGERRVWPARNEVPRDVRAGEVDRKAEPFGMTRDATGVSRTTREKVVPKGDATFEFTLDDGDTQVVTVEGEQLVARPARRTERTGDSKWR